MDMKSVSVKMMWSITEIPIISPACFRSAVTALSASEGWTDPEGWLCASIREWALSLIAFRKTSLG